MKPNYNIMKYIVLDWIFKGMDPDDYNLPQKWGNDFYSILEEIGSEIRLIPDTYEGIKIDLAKNYDPCLYIEVYGEDSHSGKKKKMHVQFSLNNFEEWDISQ